MILPQSTKEAEHHAAATLGGLSRLSHPRHTCKVCRTMVVFARDDAGYPVEFCGCAPDGRTVRQ